MTVHEELRVTTVFLKMFSNLKKKTNADRVTRRYDDTVDDRMGHAERDKVSPRTSRNKHDETVRFCRFFARRGSTFGANLTRYK